MNKSFVPSPIRQIISSGRMEIARLEREYHYWVLTSGAMLLAALLGIIALIWLFLDNSTDFYPLRIIISIAVILNLGAFYVVLQETLQRRSYLLEIKKLMIKGISFLDAIKQTFKGE